MWTGKERIILVLIVVGCMLVLIAEAITDGMVFHHKSLLEVLIGTSFYDLFLRGVIVLGFLAFTILSYTMFFRHRRAEHDMKRLNAAIESSMDGIAIYDREGNCTYVNQAYAAVNGYDAPAELIGKHIRSAYEDGEYNRIEEVCLPLLRKNGRWRGELIAKRRNGSTYFQEASVTLMEDGGRVCIIHDITWRKRSEERVRRSERFLNNIFDSIRDPFCIIDSDMRFIRANTAYADMKGRQVNDLIGMKCYAILEGRDQVCSQCVVEKTLQSGDPCAKEKQVVYPEAGSTWVEIYTYPILDEDGKVSHVIEYTRDATARKRSEEEKIQLIAKLEHLSRTDGLTGLMNRRALTDSLVYEFDRARRFRTDLTIILCDIDNFKDINDRFGHAAGDRALQALSAVFITLLRKTDIAGRYGGDEFMILLPGTSKKGAESLADKLLAVIRSTNIPMCGSENIHLSLSVGVTSITKQDQDIDALIKRADEAMYAAKQAGRNRVISMNQTD